MFHRLVKVVLGLAVVATVVTVVFLLTGGDDDSSGERSGGGDDGGAAVYAESCAACHGVDGTGLSGPAIAGGVLVERYPDVGAQIAVITEGRGAMPGFGGRLTTEDIEQVTIYTRDEL